MLHSQIEDEEIIERYARNQLAPEERQAFEEHFFGCEECFAKLQDLERFQAGVRDAAKHGFLSGESSAAEAHKAWLSWAFALSACAAVVFALISASLYFGNVANLRRQLVQAELELQKPSHAPAQNSGEVEQAEANIPLAMLQTSRSEQQPETVLLKPGDKHLVLWIELGPSRYREFRLEIFRAGNLITSLERLQRGPYGALSASIPTESLPSGDFQIKLTGQNPPPASLAGEYTIRIRTQ